MRNIAFPVAAVSLFACTRPAVGVEEAAPDNQQIVARQFVKPTDTRVFDIEYVAKVSEVPAGTKLLRVWLPVPQDSTVQQIDNLMITPTPKLTTEPKFGNKIAYVEIANPSAAVDIPMRFRCRRIGYAVDETALATDGQDAPGAFDVFAKAEGLVLVDDRIRAIANTTVAGKTTTMDKARAIYDYVVAHMIYDKAHEGWGRGSTQHACDIGKGNCTDFHALFNSLCRASGIPSGFEIGLYLPYERKSAEKLGGYHCWAYFRVPGKTWVPVDCSEAMRLPERNDFFFGGHTSNRVTLSTGRDIVLEPKQAGPPLNYFLNPYAEADGKPVKTDKTWSFQDLDSQ
jgi:transglutaminase-like putative cysteine protease